MENHMKMHTTPRLWSRSVQWKSIGDVLFSHDRRVHNGEPHRDAYHSSTVAEEHIMEIDWRCIPFFNRGRGARNGEPHRDAYRSSIMAKEHALFQKNM